MMLEESVGASTPPEFARRSMRLRGGFKPSFEFLEFSLQPNLFFLQIVLGKGRTTILVVDLPDEKAIFKIAFIYHDF